MVVAAVVVNDELLALPKNDDVEFVVGFADEVPKRPPPADGAGAGLDPNSPPPLELGAGAGFPNENPVLAPVLGAGAGFPNENPVLAPVAGAGAGFPNENPVDGAVVVVLFSEVPGVGVLAAFDPNVKDGAGAEAVPLVPPKLKAMLVAGLF